MTALAYPAHSDVPSVRLLKTRSSASDFRKLHASKKSLLVGKPLLTPIEVVFRRCRVYGTDVQDHLRLVLLILGLPLWRPSCWAPLRALHVSETLGSL